MADVWDFGPDDPIDCAVLVCLASHSNDDGASCYPSVGRIARMTRYSERTVIRSIATLEADGWLRVVHGRGRGVVSHYTVVIEKLKRCQPVTLSREKTCHPVTLLKTEKVTLTTVKGDSDDNPPAPPNRKNRQETSVKNTTPLPPSKNEGGVKKEMEATDAGDRNDESADGSDGDRDRLGSELGADAQRGRGPVAAAAAGATQRGSSEQRGSGLDAPVSAVGSGVGELAAAERVMQACGWVNRRLRPMIAEAIVLAMARGDPAAQTERRMVAMWQDLQRANCDGLLRYGISPRKFIAEAHWRTDAMWPYDREGLRNAQHAALGSRRTG